MLMIAKTVSGLEAVLKTELDGIGALPFCFKDINARSCF